MTESFELDEKSENIVKITDEELQNHGYQSVAEVFHDVTNDDDEIDDVLAEKVERLSERIESNFADSDEDESKYGCGTYYERGYRSGGGN